MTPLTKFDEMVSDSDIYTVHSTIQKCRVSKIFFNENNTLIQQGHIKWTKSDSNDIYSYKIFLFQINSVLLNFLFIK